MIPLLWVFSFLGSKYLCWQEVLWLIPINMRLHWKSQYKSITIWADAFGYFLSMGLYLFNSFVENTSLLKRETESILKSYEYVNVSSIQRVWSFTFQEHPSHPEYMSKFKWVSDLVTEQFADPILLGQYWANMVRTRDDSASTKFVWQQCIAMHCNGVTNIFLLLPPHIDSFVIRQYFHSIFTSNIKMYFMISSQIEQENCLNQCGSVIVIVFSQTFVFVANFTSNGLYVIHVFTV